MPTVAERGLGIVVGGPYSSGALVGGPNFEYAPATPAILAKVARIKAIADRHGIGMKAAGLQFAGNLLRALLRYPNLKFSLSEGGIGWIPYFLERADFTHRHHKAWTNADFGGQKPSEVFKKHIITCFIEDDFGLQNLKHIGEDMVGWECDYPHSDCTWPNSPEVVWESFKHLADETINKVTHLNVMREYNYAPFALFGRENCTVGALRAQAKAKGVNTAPALGMGGAAPKREAGKPVTSGDINAMFKQADAETAL